MPSSGALLEAMATIETAARRARRAGGAPWLLRPPQSGDIGWVVARHGALYAAANTAGTRASRRWWRASAPTFVDRFDRRAREACWIAERAGANVGCVFLVQARDESQRRGSSTATAQLRMLLVEPAARGLGIGARLVDECERFARARGYRRIVLWTNSVLTAARAIYTQGRLRAGRAASRTRASDHALVGETWELALIEHRPWRQ